MREKRVNIFCTIVAVLVMLFLIAPLVVIVIASFTRTAVVVFPTGLVTGFFSWCLGCFVRLTS